MAEKFTDKAAFIKAYAEMLVAEGISANNAIVAAEQEWDRLVDAGLAEEEREPGWYWCKAASEWIAIKFAGGKWHSAGPVFFDGTRPHIIGPRIHPPAD